jgi:hypothetical protein
LTNVFLNAENKISDVCVASWGSSL